MQNKNPKCLDKYWLLVYIINQKTLEVEMPTIYIDNEVFTELQKRAIPLVDNPNSVLRKLLSLDQPSPPKVTGTILEILLSRDYIIKYGLIPVSRSNRRFFPGFKVPFYLETAIGTLTVKVTSGNKDTPNGDPDAGDYITGGLKKLYKANLPVKSGDVLHFEILEAGKHYRLSIIRK